MYRKLMTYLESWKISTHRKPLILQGARQVGKTYSILEFGRLHYDNVAYFNFETDPKLNETFAGAIMAADNVLALFLLPFFGALSDKTSTRIGRRMSFIVGGTAAAVILMNLIPLLDDRYAASPSTGTLVLFIVVLGLLLVAMGTYRSPAVALMPDVTPKPLRGLLQGLLDLFMENFERYSL